MVNCELFNRLTEIEFQKIVKCFNVKNIFYKKEQVILSNTKNAGTVGIIVSGEAQLVRYDYNGNRTILTEYTTRRGFWRYFF